MPVKEHDALPRHQEQQRMEHRNKQSVSSTTSQPSTSGKSSANYPKLDSAEPMQSDKEQSYQPEQQPLFEEPSGAYRTRPANSGAHAMADEGSTLNMSSKTGAPYARMNAGRFDFAPYVQPALIDSLDHLSSPMKLGMNLVRPALKIAARSLFVEREQLTVSSLMSNLAAPTKSLATPPPGAPMASEPRSLPTRMLHFIFVGIPLAIIFGLLVGIRDFFIALYKDLLTVYRIATNLSSMARADISYYQEHQDELPRREAVADAAVGQLLMPNAARLVYAKLGFFAPLGKPIVNFAEKTVRQRIAKGFVQVDRLQKRFGSQKHEAVGRVPKQQARAEPTLAATQ